MQTLIALCLMLLTLALMGFGIVLVLQNFFTVPYVPSNLFRLSKVLKELQLNEKTKYLDLGAGEGATLFLAAHHGAGQAAGVEINPFLWLIGSTRKLVSPNRSKIDLQLKSMFNVSVADYNFVYLYLFPEYMHKLEDKLFSELPKGSTILSNTFRFRKHRPLKTLENKFLVYKVE